MKVGVLAKNSCIVFILSTIFILSPVALVYAEMACGDAANPAFKTICEIIMFAQGRLGRALATFLIMLSAWKFTNGKLSWQEIVTLFIGLGLFWAPKTFALFLMPDYIIGITGDGFDSTASYTPDEILTCICPNLR